MQVSFQNLKRRIHFENSVDAKRAATLRLLFYLLFVLIFTGVLVFYKFPYESLENRLEALFTERWGLKLDVVNLRPALPPKLRFNQFSLRALDYGGQPVFHATGGYLRPRILPVFWGKLAATFQAEAYGGSLNGDILLKPLDDARSCNLRLSWQAIQLERHPGLRLLLERQLSGELSGELELDGSLQELASFSGMGTLRLIKGSCPIEHPYLKVKTLDGLEVSAAFKLDRGELEITGCRFQAQGIQGTLDGIVQLQSRLHESVLDLAGQCQIDPALLDFGAGSNRGLVVLLNKNTSLPFRLRGALAAPRLSLF